MTPAELITFLRRYNEWRRGGDIEQPGPLAVGEAIDAAVEMIDRLEAAEKERDNANAAAAGVALHAGAMQDRLEAAEKSDAESIAMYRKARDERDALRTAVRHESDCVEAAKAEIKALRAKIAEMEKTWLSPEGYHILMQEREDMLFQAEKMKQHAPCKDISMWPTHHTQPTQPAPSVPTALLVAVADLCAQMEIVNRVGFVDTPNDKDSCAAFCVAEGTWLELMSAIESLASALAAAPEAKP